MIKITVYQNDKNEYVGFHTEGHAGYAPAGEDIVCSAVSVLVINTINAIETFADDETELFSDDERGEITYQFIHSPSREAALLFSALVLGLRNMVEDSEYRKYIDLRFREV